MQQIFRAVGLDEIRTISIDTLVTYQDFDDYWLSNTAFKSTVSNYINELTAEDRGRFKEEVIALVPIASEGSIQYSVRTIAATGLVPSG